MRADSDIRKDVEDELLWDAAIESTGIIVGVNKGVVTLTGFARNYGEKWQAERDAKRITGVIVVANDIEVRLPATDQRPDPEIAQDVASALQTQLPSSVHSLQVGVVDGWIKLEGHVEWNHQKQRAEDTVRHVKGVTGVTNSISIKPRLAPGDVKRQIEQALRRSAGLDAKRITVEAGFDKVTLSGTVRSWAEREEAERIAWLAPGVTMIDNQITVSL
jgi:osmotically-inducible protein OsmY